VRLPSYHALGAHTAQSCAASQPVLTRYTLLYLERREKQGLPLQTTCSGSNPFARGFFLVVYSLVLAAAGVFGPPTMAKIVGKKGMTIIYQVEGMRL
jgi:hypothetical protein